MSFLNIKFYFYFILLASLIGCSTNSFVTDKEFDVKPAQCGHDFDTKPVEIQPTTHIAGSENEDIISPKDEQKPQTATIGEASELKSSISTKTPQAPEDKINKIISKSKNNDKPQLRATETLAQTDGHVAEGQGRSIL
jgi:hypothetical protein